MVRGGKVILAKGYGVADVETGTLANEKTAFQIASVTKQFTAAGIMLLAEDGKIKLDENLGFAGCAGKVGRRHDPPVDIESNVAHWAMRAGE